jgi:hypothetical protein
MPRYRISADIVTEEELTTQQLDLVSQNAGTLVVAAAPNHVDGVDPNLRIQVVTSHHQHESTPEYRCGGCRAMSMDQINSDSQK